MLIERLWYIAKKTIQLTLVKVLFPLIKFQSYLTAVILAVLCLVQPSYADVANRGYLSRLSPDSGLSQGNVSKVLFDPEGQLWIGTENGLNVYDGYTNRVIERLPSISQAAILDFIFYQDKLVISTPELGVISVDRHDFSYQTIINKTDLLQDTLFNYVIKIHAISGQLWYASYDSVFTINNGVVESQFKLAAELMDKHSVRDFRIIDNLLLIGTSNGLYVKDLQTGTLKQLNKAITFSDDQNNIKSFWQDSNTLYVGAVLGLYRLKISEIKAWLNSDVFLDFEILLDKTNIWKIASLTPDSLLLATHRGLLEFDISSKRLTDWVVPSKTIYQFTDDDIMDFTQDRRGNYWLATRGDGAYFFRPFKQQFQTIYSTPGQKSLNSNMVYTLFEHQSGLYVGTVNGMSHIDDLQNIENYLTIADDLVQDSTATIYFILGDYHADNFWLVTPFAIQQFSGKTKQIITPTVAKDSLVHKLLTTGSGSSIVDSNNTLYTVKVDGVYKITVDLAAEKLEALSSAFPDLTSIVFSQFDPQNPKQLYVSYGSGLWIYDTELGNLKKVFELPNPGSELHYIEGMVWINNSVWILYSDFGLLELDKTSFQLKRKVNAENGLTDKSLYALQRDNRGNLWMSSHAGLLRYNPNSNTVKRFDVNDGLAINEFNAGASIQMRNGKMVYGSQRGLVSFFAEQVDQRSTLSNDLYITNIRLLSKNVDFGVKATASEDITLEHDDYGLMVSFSTMAFEKQNQTEYRYWIEGKSDIPLITTRENVLLLPQLSPGQYKLQIRAFDNVLEKNSNIATLNITVNYSTFNSPLARGLYLASALLLFTIWNIQRLNKKRYLEKTNHLLAESSERLELALQSTHSHVWQWREIDNKFFQNRLTDLLSYDASLLDWHDASVHQRLIHVDDKERYMAAWRQCLLGQTEHLDVNYRMQHANGEWLWFKDIGRVKQQDQHIHITGTFTNITEERVVEEKAKIFGIAFEQTRDWVIILSTDFKVVSVNQAFNNAYAHRQNSYYRLPDLPFSTEQMHLFVNVLNDLQVNQHWQGEDNFRISEEFDIPAIVKISAIGNENQVEYYVVVVTDITAQKNAEAELRTLANYDQLTKLPNRNLLLDRIQHALLLAERRQRKVGLFFLDLNRFKQVNDSLGHDMGDLLLTEIASRLRKGLRGQDTVARLGGDEFVILLEDFERTEQISTIAQNVLGYIDQPVDLKGNIVSVGASIGIAIYPDDAKDAETLLKHADIAMYHGKHQGGNQYSFFLADMNVAAQSKLQLESQVKLAAQKQQFTNYYQPIVDAKAQCIVGFELLLRWNNQGKMVPPNVFIPVLEDLALIADVTWHALQTAAKDLLQWHTLDPNLYVSVNFSARHIGQPKFAEQLYEQVKATGLPCQAIKVEVTESALVADSASAEQCMKQLKGYGFALYLDDFGTGYSSLTYLQNFPFDTLKIDRSFTQKIDEHGQATPILNAILSLAHSLHLNVIAEGIETAAQSQYLVGENCPLQQGFLYSPAVERTRVPEMLQQVANWFNGS